MTMAMPSAGRTAKSRNPANSSCTGCCSPPAPRDRVRDERQQQRREQERDRVDREELPQRHDDQQQAGAAHRQPGDRLAGRVEDASWRAAATPCGTTSGSIAPEAGSKKLSPIRIRNMVAASASTLGRTPASVVDSTMPERSRPQQVGADHQPPPLDAVGHDPAQQADDHAGHAVGHAHGDHAAGAADVVCQPHERQKRERVAEPRDGRRAPHEPEVAQAEQAHPSSQNAIAEIR